MQAANDASPYVQALLSPCWWRAPEQVTEVEARVVLAEVIVGRQ